MRSHHAGELLLAEAAASVGIASERAQGILETLRRVVPYDGAWLALADPLGGGYHSLASVDLDEPVVDFLSGPLMARDIEVTGTDRARPPLSPSDLPYPAEELPTWAECLMPSGIHEALPSPCSPRTVGTSGSSPSCPAAGNHRPRQCAAGSHASRPCWRTASTRCVRCSPPLAWSGGRRPA